MLGQTGRFCLKCNNKVQVDFKFCPKCGIQFQAKVLTNNISIKNNSYDNEHQASSNERIRLLKLQGYPETEAKSLATKTMSLSDEEFVKKYNPIYYQGMTQGWYMSFMD